jgi:diaminopimelate epimerase
VPRVPFTKVQGLGNDFIVVDLRPGRPGAEARPSPLDPALARALCDRHFGIGADGVLAILPGESGQARMRIINADGTEAEMCGNGIRCVAKFLYEKDPTLQRPVIDIDTGAGRLACAVQASAGVVQSVEVQMGRPRLLRKEIPMSGPGHLAGEPAIRMPITAGDRTFAFTAVSMGNPHAVIFVDDESSSLRRLAEAYGPRIEVDPLFPRRTNVEFARVYTRPSGVELELVVWERGCGITLACGTGACATAVAAYIEGRAAQLGAIPIHLPGGTLEITLQTERNAPHTIEGVLMRGPASVVFESEMDPADFLPTARTAV